MISLTDNAITSGSPSLSNFAVLELCNGNGTLKLIWRVEYGTGTAYIQM